MPNNKLISLLVSVFLIVGSVYLGILSWNATRAHDYIGVSEEKRYSIAVSGEGRVTAIPDVALLELGYNVEKKTVAEAQKDNSEKMNAVLEKIKGDFKIDAKDIRTSNYSIFPAYDWSDGEQKLRGYQVSQSLSLKIRDLEKVSAVIEAAGQAGLNQVGGLSFIVDDPEALKKEAREKALKQAKEKALSLAAVAGVKLGRLVSFSESGSQPMPIYREALLKGDAAGAASVAPMIEAGSSEIVITATVEYEIL